MSPFIYNCLSFSWQLPHVPDVGKIWRIGSAGPYLHAGLAPGKELCALPQITSHQYTHPYSQWKSVGTASPYGWFLFLQKKPSPCRSLPRPNTCFTCDKLDRARQTRAGSHPVRSNLINLSFLLGYLSAWFLFLCFHLIDFSKFSISFLKSDLLYLCPTN